MSLIIDIVSFLYYALFCIMLFSVLCSFLYYALFCIMLFAYYDI